MAGDPAGKGLSAGCPACGHGNREGSKFCARCGTPLAATCPACGTANEPGDRFCVECGRPLAAPVPAEVATPDHLAERILRDRPTMEGERKQVTVLFADVKGSMDLAAGLDPEEWAGIMQRFFSVLSDGVHRFEGTVDKFTGDGIMALFGAPVAHEDHARRAAQAARHLVDAVAGYADELRRTKGLSFSVRLGLNSGEVVVGGIGDDARMSYTALGHTVGLAQRMESMAEPGRAYLTGHTASLVSRWFRLEALGPVPVKGVPAPIDVFVLGGPLLQPEALAGGSGASPLVGRSGELAVLEAALDQARDGQAQIIGVVGEAGVGKSRLCEEFTRTCRDRRITVRHTAGLSHARGIPLLPILALLRDYFEITDADSARAARDKVAGRLLVLDPAFEETLPLLYDFLEIPDPERPPPRLSPELRMQRILEVLRRLIQRRSAEEPLVLVLEDLHWFDAQSAAFLEELFPSYPGSRTLVVANFRPEFQARWMEEAAYRRLPLGPLDPEAVAELLTGLLGEDPSLVRLAGHIMERTGGNPFFIEEVVRTLIEDRALQGERGGYRLARSLDEVRVPPTVQATLAARIDRLGRREKQLLQTAAVIGRSFPEPVLMRVANGSGGADLPPALLTLCTGEFLIQEGPGPVAQYRFWHPLTQEVAYGSLLTERRAQLHGAVAQAIIELEPERLDERAALIASHYERAGERLEAARWHARAAARVVRSDVAEAMSRWRAAVALLDGLPESDEVLRLGVAARTRLVQFGNRSGLPAEEIEALFLEGKALAERLDDIGLLAGITQFSGTVKFAAGKVWDAVERFEEAAGFGEREVVDVARRAALWMSPPVMRTYYGPLPQALSLADRVIDLCQGDHELGVQYAGYSPLLSSIRARAEVLCLMGRLAEAYEAVGEVLALARQRAESEMITWSISTLARVVHFSGDDRDVVAEAGEGFRLTEETGNRLFHPLALAALGLAQLMAGRHKEAVDTLWRGIEDGREQRGQHFEEHWALAYLARAHLAGGDGPAAQRAADEAVAVAYQQEARPISGCALLVRAHVWRVTEGSTARDRILVDLDAASTVIGEVGALVYEPFIVEERGWLSGDNALLREAVRRFAAVGATGHARRLEGELPPERADRIRRL